MRLALFDGEVVKMDKKLWTLILVCIGTAGCAAATDGSGNGIEKPSAGTKSDAVDRLCEQAGFEAGCDICQEQDWYDDGTCDDFCSERDGDCPITLDEFKALSKGPDGLLSAVGMNEGLIHIKYATVPCDPGPDCDPDANADGSITKKVHACTRTEAQLITEKLDADLSWRWDLEASSDTADYGFKCEDNTCSHHGGGEWDVASQYRFARGKSGNELRAVIQIEDAVSEEFLRDALIFTADALTEFGEDPACGE